MSAEDKRAIGDDGVYPILVQTRWMAAYPTIAQTFMKACPSFAPGSPEHEAYLASEAERAIRPMFYGPAAKEKPVLRPLNDPALRAALVASWDQVVAEGEAREHQANTQATNGEQMRRMNRGWLGRHLDRFSAWLGRPL